MTAKTMDNHNRWRSKTVAFRMSPEEASQLDAFVQMSGLPKQDYLIQREIQAMTRNFREKEHAYPSKNP